MAIVQTGSILTFPLLGTGNTGTVSTTITVPADAEIVIVGWSSFSSTANFFSGGSMTFTKGGVDTTMLTPFSGGSTTLWTGELFYLVLPDTGSNKTLKWDWIGTNVANDESLCSVTFWKGIDTVSPIRGSGSALGVSPLPYTTGIITAVTNDLIIAWTTWFVANVEGTINTWSNLTLLSQIAHAANADAAWATGSPSGNTTVAASTGTNVQDGSIFAISLKPAPVVSSSLMGFIWM